MTRRRGLSLRWKLTLSYAGFLLVAGAVLAVLLLVGLRFVPDERVQRVSDGGFAPTRSDLLEAIVPLTLWALLFLAVVGVVGGWLLAGRMLRPLEQVAAAARLAAAGSLSHRIALPGPRDELRELADTFDDALERLQRSFDEQQRFAANASHELRTPLTVTRTMLEVARADPASVDLHELLSRLDATNDRAIATVESLLALARLDRGQLRLVAVDLAALARSAGAPADALAPAWAHGDPVLLGVLVGNLLDNAGRHGTGDPVVTTGIAAAEVALTVENAGEPLAPELVATLTEPFVRASRARGGTVPGSGLGLTIAASIVRAHGGELRLRARDGGGLAVRVTLPRSAEPAPTASL